MINLLLFMALPLWRGNSMTTVSHVKQRKLLWGSGWRQINTDSHVFLLLRVAFSLHQWCRIFRVWTWNISQKPPFFFQACAWRGKWDPSPFFPLPLPRNKGRSFGAPPVYAMMFCFTVDTEWRKPTLHGPRPSDWWAEFTLSLKFTALGFCCSNRKLITHSESAGRKLEGRKKQRFTLDYLLPTWSLQIGVISFLNFSCYSRILCSFSLQVSEPAFPFCTFFYSLREGMVLTSSLYSAHI